MERRQYVHLDMARGLAALLVFGGHLRSLIFVDFVDMKDPGLIETLFYFLTGVGDQSVMVFFVLSGFLISRQVVEAMGSGAWCPGSRMPPAG